MSKIGRVQSKTVIKYSTETWLSDLQRGERPFNGNPIIWVLVGARDAKKPSRGSRLKPTSCFRCKHVSPLSTWLDYLKKKTLEDAALQVRIMLHLKWKFYLMSSAVSYVELKLVYGPGARQMLMTPWPFIEYQ